MPSMGGSDSDYGGDDYSGEHETSTGSVASSNTDGVGNSGGLSGHDGRSTYSSGYSTDRDMPGGLASMSRNGGSIEGHVANVLGYDKEFLDRDMQRRQEDSVWSRMSDTWEKDRKGSFGGMMRDDEYGLNRIPDNETIRNTGLTKESTGTIDELSNKMNTGNYKVEDGKIVDDKTGQVIDAAMGVGRLGLGVGSLITGNPTGIVGVVGGLKGLSNLKSDENWMEAHGFHNDGDTPPGSRTVEQGSGPAAGAGQGGSGNGSARTGGALSSLGGGENGAGMLGNGRGGNDSGQDPAAGLIPKKEDEAEDAASTETSATGETTSADSEEDAADSSTNMMQDGLEKLNALADGDGTWSVSDGGGLSFTPGFFSFTDAQDIQPTA